MRSKQEILASYTQTKSMHEYLAALHDAIYTNDIVIHAVSLYYIKFRNQNATLSSLLKSFSGKAAQYDSYSLFGPP